MKLCAAALGFLLLGTNALAADTSQLLREGRYKDLEAAAKKQLKENPNDPNAMLALAAVYANHAIAADPTQADAYALRAAVNAKLNNRRLAESDLRSAAERNNAYRAPLKRYESLPRAPTAAGTGIGRASEKNEAPTAPTNQFVKYGIALLAGGFMVIGAAALYSRRT